MVQANKAAETTPLDTRTQRMSAHDTPSALRTPLCDLLGCPLPRRANRDGLGRGLVSLVAATTNAGGFGFLAGRHHCRRPDRGTKLSRVNKLTQRPPLWPELSHVPAQRPAAAGLGGEIAKSAPSATAAGQTKKRLADCVMQASSACPPSGALKHAQKAIEMGANAITIQGGEGGGHTGCCAHHRAVAAGGRCRGGAGGGRWRFLRWARPAGGAGLWRPGHCHGYALFDDQ